MAVRKAKLGDLEPDSKNANEGTEYGRSLLEESITKLGLGRSILIDKKNRIIAGNKTSEAAGGVGLEDVLIVETDGKKLIAVKRTDLDLETDEEARKLAFADNRTGELNLLWNTDRILESYRDGLDLKPFWSGEDLKTIEARESGPSDFPEHGEDIPTDYCCPKCGYEWSGKPK